MLYQYRFYSRKQGWIGSNINSKYFYTNTIKLHQDVRHKLEGMTGQEIIDSKFTADAALLKQAKIYSDWYLYPASIKIGCSTEYYI